MSFASVSVRRIARWRVFRSIPASSIAARGESFCRFFCTTFPDRLSVRARERISTTFGKLFARPRVWRVAAFFQSHFSNHFPRWDCTFSWRETPHKMTFTWFAPGPLETQLNLAQPVAGLDWSNARKHGPAAAARRSPPQPAARKDRNRPGVIRSRSRTRSASE